MKNFIHSITHTIRLLIARRQIASGISGFEAAHRSISTGAERLTTAIGATSGRLAEARQAFADIVDKAMVELDRAEFTAQAMLGTLEQERAKAIRQAEKFKQFLEA